MSVIWGRHDNKQVLVPVVVLPGNTIKDDLLAEAAARDLRVRSYSALLDTGAACSAITAKVAGDVGLVPVGMTPVQGVAGKTDRRNYLVMVGFRAHLARSADDGAEVATVQILERPLEVVEFEAGSFGFDVLLGMDVIATGSLKVEGNGTFSFAF